MKSNRRCLQTLVRSGIRGCKLFRADRTGPVGKYFASIQINGQSQTGYDCCVLCKQLLKTGKNSPRLLWKHKTRHLKEGAKYSDKELKEIIKTFNKQQRHSPQEGIRDQFQCESNNEPLLKLNLSLKLD